MDADDPRAWGPEETARVAEAFYLGWIDLQHDITSEHRHMWASSRVDHAVWADLLPLRVLDALLHAGDDAPPVPPRWELDEDEEWEQVAAYRAYVAAGPLEDLLRMHGDRHDAAVLARCRVDPVWAEAVTGVWMGRERWKQLPYELRRLVPEPQRVPWAWRPDSVGPRRRRDRRGPGR